MCSAEGAVTQRSSLKTCSRYSRQGNAILRVDCTSCGVLVDTALEWPVTVRRFFPSPFECQKCFYNYKHDRGLASGNGGWNDDVDAFGSWSNVVRAYEDDR